ncbi:MAG: YncE family protein, partial [Lysobacter sp.]
MLTRWFCVALLGMASLSSFAGEILVGNKAADTVWRLSLDDGRKLGEFPTNQAPHEIAVSHDGAIALVANYGGREQPGHTLSVLDLRGNTAPRIIDLGEHGRPHGLRFLPGDREALATTEVSHHLLRIDIANGKIVAEIPLGEGKGHMVALAADAKTAYVTQVDRGTVSRIDLR